ncbi:MAG: hypothetical protein V4670_12155 [Bacteroidota bacterium]
MFAIQSIDDVMYDLQKMYFTYICHNDIEAIERQTATDSFKILAKTLTSIKNKTRPNNVTSFKMNTDI